MHVIHDLRARRSRENPWWPQTKGTILADQAIPLGTGARLDGRALARIAAVNLDSNTIVSP
jgi:FAD/FMN-containing dehydrogenase